MGEWVVGAFINLFGSVAINFGTNLLKLGHNQRERLSMLDNDGVNGKIALKPIIYFQTWRVGILFFSLGNCLNFISFGYAAQSLLAALGSIQFVSNIAFAYFVLNKMVTVKVLVATAFIVLGNIFLVAFGNLQSPVYTPEQLVEKYSNIIFLLYCLILALIVAIHHSIYRRGELMLAVSVNDLSSYWHMLLPFSYAVVSGAVGSCSVLFAKSLLLGPSSPFLQDLFTSKNIKSTWGTYQSFTLIMHKLTIESNSWFFPLGGEVKDSSLVSSMDSSIVTDMDRMVKLPCEETEIRDTRSFGKAMMTKATSIITKAKAACMLSLGLGEDSISASSVLAMPMVSSRMTGFRGAGFDRTKFLSLRSPGWSKISMNEDDAEMMETSSILS
ncbi:PREDICTED: probable magnesium transporter NIPA8 isoform X1 [Nelumbo nucifera]|uniref:Probable magnesium transporter n=1 Tax=Nelumbo nucifera TaxID=4432 RepID=A0A1U8Q0X8_NELNU|nr:PREDICTED: probable magnesium transporter NIPA8 isoform X1 [Nelumbo nucifera]